MATSTSSAASTPVFHNDDPEQITEYRTLSVLAVISLVIGIISPVAIAGTFLLAIPFTGIAVSLLALRQIAVSGGLLAGRWAATLGLALAVASVVFPISHDVIQRTLRVNDAEKFGKDWIAMVTSGKLEQAFHETVDASRAPAPPEPGAPPSAAPPVNPLQAFRDNPIIKSLQAAGPNASIRVLETTDFQAITYRSISVRQLYSVSPATASSAGAQAQPVELALWIQRGTLPRDSISRWMVTRFEPPKPTDGASASR